MEERLELLRRVPLFAEVPDDVLARLAGMAEERELPVGSALTHEGRHEGWFFIIETGSVLVERGGKPLNTLGPGDFLGSIALVDAGPRTATAIAVTPSRVLAISNEQFRELLDGSPALRDAIFAAADHNLQTLDDEATG